MSKIGEKPIEIPSNTNVVIEGKKISIKGPLGEMVIELPPVLELVKLENNILSVKCLNKENRKAKSLYGLYRQLIFNGLKGVNQYWEKRLKIVGTGYNVKLDKEDLVFKLGYSHPVVFHKVPGIIFKVEGNNIVIVQGVDKQKVGEVAYQIKMLKKPDVYKGKGIQYEGEKLRIKPGKKAKTAGAA